MDSSNPGPSGSRGPAVRSRLASASRSPSPNPSYACEFPGCTRTFDTATGRGVHHRRGHPDWYDARQNVVPSKARWSDEEVRLLARREAELTRAGERFMNQALHVDFRDRTLEGIKKRRRQPSYRQLVLDMLEDEVLAPDTEDEADDNITDVDLDRMRRTIAEYLLSLPNLNDRKFDSDTLSRICRSVSLNDATRVFDELTGYLKKIFPVEARKKNKPVNEDSQAAGSRKQARRVEYARTQDLWRKNRSKCARLILDDISNVRTPAQDVMVPYWRTVMQGSPGTSPGPDIQQPPKGELWMPITPREIKRALPSNTTSAGPDGLSARSLRAVPLGVLERILNLILWCGKAPAHLLRSATVLIPKKSNAHLPSDFRPITISSVLIRALHKVLATRIAGSIKLDQRQRAFRPTDGCSDSVFLVDLILRYHHQRHKPLFMASLDIAKAFDSVSHETIKETLLEFGLPGTMIGYVADVYEKSKTVLSCGSWTSGEIRPTCGVKQGDPMSPMIFNMVIDRMLRKLPEEIGAKIGDLIINATAFADDMMLFASTPVGLQRLLDTAIEFLHKCGLDINAAKCMTISLRSVPHEKKTVVDKTTVFRGGGDRVLPAMKRTDEWRYLGIPFTAEGRLRIDITKGLQDSLSKLSKAPLKPQQRLFILRTHVLPSLYHKLELGIINLSTLRKGDRIVRMAVRGWLGLPSDTPNGYFHATIKDGGLGIPSMRWVAPLNRLRRLCRLPVVSQQEEQAPGSFLIKEKDRCRERLKEQATFLNNQSDVNNRWARLLYDKVDGAGLRESSKVPQQHAWVGEGTRFLTGRDYLQSCKLRINALPTKSRTSRGRHEDRRCRAGCNAAETLNHVLQRCHRTHGARVSRHDAVTAYVSKTLSSRGYEVSVEPRIQSAIGVRKPDIVAKLGVTAIVVDAQVVNDQFDLDTAHRRKKDYYKDIESCIRDRFKVEEVRFMSATLSWRGLWSAESAKDLTGLGILRVGQLKVMASRVIVGGLACFHLFNKSTEVKGRTGGRR